GGGTDAAQRRMERRRRGAAAAPVPPAPGASPRCALRRADRSLLRVHSGKAARAGRVGCACRRAGIAAPSGAVRSEGSLGCGAPTALSVHRGGVARAPRLSPRSLVESSFGWVIPHTSGEEPGCAFL